MYVCGVDTVMLAKSGGSVALALCDRNITRPAVAAGIADYAYLCRKPQSVAGCALRVRNRRAGAGAGVTGDGVRSGINERRAFRVFFRV